MKQKLFRKLFDELLAAKTELEINTVLYRHGGEDRQQDGVDLAFQHENLTWEDHERLFDLAGKLSKALQA